MSNTKKHILIAGGTGLIGKKLEEKLNASGYEVSILTRNKKRVRESSAYRLWNPDEAFIQENTLGDVDILINLCGAGIADSPWTKARKKELHDSRINPTLLLLEEAKKTGKIELYISASGINCYPVNTKELLREENSYGPDYLSTLVQQWEEAAMKFNALCPVSLLRISAVMSENGGALAKMKPLFRWGLGAPLGTGKQPFTWVHEDDLVDAILYIIKHQLAGAFNICGETVTNREFSKILAKSVNRWMIPIPVPAFVLRLMLGQMSEMLLNGVNTDSEKLVATGFKYRYPRLQDFL